MNSKFLGMTLVVALLVVVVVSVAVSTTSVGAQRTQAQNQTEDVDRSDIIGQLHEDLYVRSSDYDRRNQTLSITVISQGPNQRFRVSDGLAIFKQGVDGYEEVFVLDEGEERTIKIEEPTTWERQIGFLVEPHGAGNVVPVLEDTGLVNLPRPKGWSVPAIVSLLQGSLSTSFAYILLSRKRKRGYTKP